MLEYLEEIGLKLVNQKDQATYIAYNGQSTIDLVFTNSKSIHPHQQRIIPISIRKHLPVETTFMLGTHTARRVPSAPQPTRKLDPTQLNHESIARITDLTTNGKIDEALEGITLIMTKGII